MRPPERSSPSEGRLICPDFHRCCRRSSGGWLLNDKLTSLAAQPISAAEGGECLCRRHQPAQSHRAGILAPNLRGALCYMPSFRPATIAPGLSYEHLG
jgi:hypothetical protein